MQPLRVWYHASIATVLLKHNQQLLSIQKECLSEDLEFGKVDLQSGFTMPLVIILLLCLPMILNFVLEIV